MGRMVIVSGPSCAGKGPLLAALARLHPKTAARLHKLVLINSRRPRPGERDGVDYHFRSREEIESLRGREGYLVMEVRGDLQALALDQVDRSGEFLFEGNPFVATALLDSPLFRGLERLSVFLSPFSREEILALKSAAPRVSLPDFVAEVMRRKLLRRGLRQRGVLSLPDLEDVERRAGSAFRELRMAWRFEHVIANHDGEDSENWDAFYYPIGDARRTLVLFTALLEGNEPPGLEKWEEDLLS